MRTAILRGVALAAMLVHVSGSAVGQAEPSRAPESSVVAPLASRSLLLDGASAGDRLVVVGEWGHVLVSEDHGRSWSQANVPTRATLTAVVFHDADLGWAVGHDAIILRTTDGGATWETLHYAPEEERPLLDVWFEDANRGIAIGAYGFFLVTTDGGDSWSPRPISEYDDFHLNHFARAASGRRYIAAEAGSIYRSDDDGRTWTSLPSPYGGSLFATLPLEGDSLLVFGLRGHLFRSDDAGDSWEELETSTQAMLTDGVRLKDGTIVVTGLEGTLLVSRDDGHDFELIPQSDRQALATLLQAADGGLVLVGEFGVHRVSPDDLR